MISIGRTVLATLWRHKKKSIAIGLGALLVLLIGSAMSRPAQPEYVTEAAKRGDLRQTVEAVGTVISERDLELTFAGIGIVQSVSVKEGDRIRAGQRLAQLRSGNLGASVASQQASLQSALADLAMMEEGTRPEDIAVAEADLAAKRAALQVAQSALGSAENNLITAASQLEVLKQETSVNLSGNVSTSMSTLQQEFVDIENALSVIDDVLNDVEVQDAIVRYKPGADNDIRAQKRAAIDSIDAARRLALGSDDYTKALKALDAGRAAAITAGTAMDSLFSVVSALQETSHFSNADREAIKNTISAQRSALQTSGSTIGGQLSGLQNASASYASRIAGQESTIRNLEGTRDRAKTDILTYQAAIGTSQAQLALKKAGSRPADIAAARARVRAAQANVARAAADYNDTILVSPVNGIVSHVNIKAGEAQPAGAAMTVLGDSPFRVEMFVSEIDVPKLQLTQTGSVELDAFRGVNMKLRLTQIDSSPTLKDGVSKYGVKLDFLHEHPEVKIGMTGDAVIVTGERTDVVSVPGRAVLEKTGDEGQITNYVRVLKDDQTVEEKTVITGMEGESGEIEIMNGLSEGDVVIVLEKK